MIRAHVAAVKALLDAAVTTYEAGAVPANAPMPYVILSTDSGRATVENLAAQSTRRTWAVWTTAVSASAESARLGAEKAQGALLDAVPVVPGRSCSPIGHDVSRPLEVDNDRTPPLLYVVDQWSWISTPV